MTNRPEGLAGGVPAWGPGGRPTLSKSCWGMEPPHPRHPGFNRLRFGGFPGRSIRYRAAWPMSRATRMADRGVSAATPVSARPIGA